MHLLLNCLAATAAGGLTYVRNVLPHLAERRDVRTTAVVPRRLREELAELGAVSFVDEREFRARAAARFLVEQAHLPGLIRRLGVDVLVSAGNVALFRSPVPQILLSRNSLYTSSDFHRDLVARRELGLWLDTVAKGWLARRSIGWADCTVTPSEAFSREVRRWARRPARVEVIPHGFDRVRFFQENATLPSGTAGRLATADGHLRLLFVSHYNYFRNFDTLIRALPMVKERLAGKGVKLVLTCELRPMPEWAPYDPQPTAELARTLGVTEDIVELGLVPYRPLHKVYRACDIYVTPAYAESFAHPLVEAMASGLPVVASDLAVHLEVCGDAALYFPRFSPEALAEHVARLAGSPALGQELAERGRRRAGEFSWESHVDRLVALAQDLLARRSSSAPRAAGDTVATGREDG